MLKYMLGNRKGNMMPLLYLNVFSFSFMSGIYYFMK